MEGYFWPKIFWDFATKTLDPAVKPIPVLQTINLVFGLILLAWEWPLSFLAGSSLHRSLEARLAFLPLAALAAALLYQGTNAAIYEVVGLGVYFWAYSEGEVRFHPAWFDSTRTLTRWNRWSARSLGLYRNGLREVPVSRDAHMHIPVHIHPWCEYAMPPAPLDPRSHCLAMTPRPTSSTISWYFTIHPPITLHVSDWRRRTRKGVEVHWT